MASPLWLRFLQLLPPEQAHSLALWLFSNAAPFYPAPKNFASSINPSCYLPKELAAIKNPIGLAAGFDKNAQCLNAFAELGFGFAEVGTVTPKPQKGNSKPRLFRLPEHYAVINRMGFNNHGLEIIKQRLDRYRRAAPAKPRYPIGINIGMNKNTLNPQDDYTLLIKELGIFADYLVLNISSPNTPNLRQLQQKNAFEPLIDAAIDARKQLAPHRPLLFIKIDPDMNHTTLQQLATLAHQYCLDGIIATNTTLSRPSVSTHRHAPQVGGLSGKPLFAPSNQLLGRLTSYLRAQHPENQLIIIAVGGVSSGIDAYEKFCLGAHLVQLYTALVYQGPTLLQSINNELISLLKSKGHTHIKEIIGSKFTK